MEALEVLLLLLSMRPRVTKSFAHSIIYFYCILSGDDYGFVSQYFHPYSPDLQDAMDTARALSFTIDCSCSGRRELKLNRDGFVIIDYTKVKKELEATRAGAILKKILSSQEATRLDEDDVTTAAKITKLYIDIVPSCKQIPPSTVLGMKTLAVAPEERLKKIGKFFDELRSHKEVACA
jgi:hypothetical protein